MSTARQLLQQALTLDEGERADLALQLMDSLSPPEARDEDAWIDEIERRAERALSDVETGLDANDVFDPMTRNLGL